MTTSYPKPTPEWLNEWTLVQKAKRGELDVEAEAASKKAKRATVAEECPKCKHPTMEYYTMQLRSADEGQTVFYECPKCGHTYSENN